MSITFIGLITTLVGFLFQQSGVNIAPDKIQTTIEVITQAVGLVIIWYGRFKQGDVRWFGKKI